MPDKDMKRRRQAAKGLDRFINIEETIPRDYTAWKNAEEAKAVGFPPSFGKHLAPEPTKIPANAEALIRQRKAEEAAVSLGFPPSFGKYILDLEEKNKRLARMPQKPTE